MKSDIVRRFTAGKRRLCRLRGLLPGLFLCLGMAVAAPVQAATDSSQRDFSGMWEPKTFGFLVHDAPLNDETRARIKSYMDMQEQGMVMQTAWTSCRPGAVSAMVMPRETIMVMQSPDEIDILFEMPRMTRRIRMDAQHPKDLEASYMGDSVGHWEGNTLVIDTIGFNGHAELDAQGLPAGPKMHTVERLTKSGDGDTINMKITFSDPEHYEMPFTIERSWGRSDKRHQLEYDCSENPRIEDFKNAFYLQDIYRPTCVRIEGEGMELSHMECRKPEEWDFLAKDE